MSGWVEGSKRLHDGMKPQGFEFKPSSTPAYEEQRGFRSNCGEIWAYVSRVSRLKQEVPLIIIRPLGVGAGSCLKEDGDAMSDTNNNNDPYRW